MTTPTFDNDKIDRTPIRVDLADAQYPKRVKSIMGKSAPKHLDMVGNLDLLNLVSIGFCGSRKISEKGLEVIRDCAGQAAQSDVSVISGNAAGVDLEAHFKSLEEGGKTILVLPEGINHFRIKKDLRPVWDWERVLVISQFAPDEPWQVYRAMTRNQLLVALSKVMVVIEAGEKGGTMNAGETALKAKVPLFVAKYQDMSINARGNQILLDRGALTLKKDKETNRAGLEEVFEKMREEEFPENLTQQEYLL